MQSIQIYPVIACILIAFIISKFNSLASKRNAVIFVATLTVSFMYTTLINGQVHGNYSNIFFLYLLQPLAIVCFFSFESRSNCIKRSILASKAICMLSVPIFCGCIYFYLVHLANFPDPAEIFAVEFTWAGGEVVLRNPSFLGSSLLLCGVSLIQFLLGQYIWRIRGEYIYLVFSLLAVINIGLSVSRRALLPVLLFFLILVLLNPRKYAAKVLLLLTCIFGVIFAYDPHIFSLFIKKLFSIFDIFNDSSNVSRVTLMLAGIEDILLRPWGLGFGALSSVGYTVQEVHSLENVRVTESSIISLVGELGLPASLLIGGLLFIYLNRLRKSVVCLFIVPLLIESVVGLGLYAPVVSFFTISMLVIMYNLEQSTRNVPSVKGLNQSTRAAIL